MAYDEQIEPVVFAYLDGNDYETFQDKYDFFLVNQKDPDYFDFRYNFEKKALEFHDDVIRELKKYFRNPPSMIIRDLGQVYRPREQFYNFELPLTFNDRLGIGSTHLPLLQPV